MSFKSIVSRRPTGRTRNYGDDKKPYLEVGARPYIKGLMTRFMLRFIVADTIEEINHYKEEFDRYIERYGDEFPEAIKSRMLKQYGDRKQSIKSVIVKPLSINFDPSQMVKNPETAFDFYLQQAIASLIMFGFRIQEIKGEYKVSVPEQYYLVRANLGYSTKVISPVKLILLWTWNEDYTYSCDRDFYGIKNHTTPLKYCRCSFSGDDTICSSCANNID